MAYALQDLVNTFSNQPFMGQSEWIILWLLSRDASDWLVSVQDPIGTQTAETEYMQ